jgi:hypothetical protein
MLKLVKLVQAANPATEPQKDTALSTGKPLICLQLSATFQCCKFMQCQSSVMWDEEACIATGPGKSYHKGC